MIYLVERDARDHRQYQNIDFYDEPSCLTLSCAGKFIAFIELVFYTFVFIQMKNFLSGDVDKLYILALILALLSIFSFSLWIGVINQSRLFIMPWIWLKYALVALQLIRFVSIVVELSANEKNTVGASPIFELLILGYNVFSLSIISELLEEIEPYSFKRFQYIRVA